MSSQAHRYNLLAYMQMNRSVKLPRTAPAGLAGLGGAYLRDDIPVAEGADHADRHDRSVRLAAATGRQGHTRSRVTMHSSVWR